MVVNGEATIELSNSGEFLTGGAKFDLEAGQITPPWDPDSPLRIDEGKLAIRYVKETDVVEIEPSTLSWGESKATFSGEFRPVRDANGIPTSWDFTVKADDAVLAVEEHGLAPMKIDEWQATGSFVPEQGQVTISRLAIRSGDASIALAGTVVDTPGAEEVHLSGEISPMPVDVLKRLWPKFLAGKARGWVLERVAGGQVTGGTFAVNLGPGDLAKIEAGGDVPPEAVHVELNLSGMSIAYIPKMPPVLTGEVEADGVGHGVRRRYSSRQDRHAVGTRARP